MDLGWAVSLVTGVLVSQGEDTQTHVQREEGRVNIGAETQYVCSPKPGTFRSGWESAEVGGEAWNGFSRPLEGTNANDSLTADF